MLSVGRALMTGANFIMLDEPSMGLAPLLMYDMFRALKELNSQGMTLLLIEQNARIALQFAHRGYVLDTGAIVATGKAKELMNNPDVKKAYLGADSQRRLSYCDKPGRHAWASFLPDQIMDHDNIILIGMAAAGVHLGQTVGQPSRLGLR